MGFEPGSLHLWSRRATNCVTRPDIHNQLNVNQVLFIYLYHVLDVEKFFLCITLWGMIFEIVVGCTDSYIYFFKLYKLYKLWCSRWFSNPSSFEAVYCFICGRWMVAVTWNQMICHVLVNMLQSANDYNIHMSQIFSGLITVKVRRHFFMPFGQ